MKKNKIDITENYISNIKDKNKNVHQECKMTNLIKNK